ncbi:hypothetical protein [Streptomyces sp. URMC 123]|uniref:hypothetical protein n=1 Tax=Streptomyces sp. URMC 123 TaxID=3423403 RepID=UPI003F1C911A
MRAKRNALSAGAALGLLLLATACGGGSGSEDKGPGRAAPGRPLNQEQLDHAAFATDDLPGFVASRSAAKPDRSAKAADPACQPIVAAVGDRINPRAKQSALRSVSDRAAPGSAYAVDLTSYTAADARQAMRDLRSALDTCADGFEATTMGRPVSYTSVKKKPVRAGDEAVGIEMVGQGMGRKATVNYVVARQGSTMIMVLAADPALRKSVPVPPRLVDKQVEKVAALGG